MEKREAQVSYKEGSSIEVVDLPLRTPGPLGADAKTIQIRHLPNHVLSQVEGALQREQNGFRYDKSPGMSDDDPTEVLAWLAGGLQGAELLDKTSSKQLDRLVSEFARTRKADRSAFFKDRIRPFFTGLGTGKRS